MPQNRDLDKLTKLLASGNFCLTFSEINDIASYLVDNGLTFDKECPIGCPGTLSKYDLIR